jgi:23S rRNA (uracil1939-C5)-methyltransferase
VLEHTLNAPPIVDSAKRFWKSYGVDFTHSFLGPHAWRCRARLAVRRGPNGHAQFGLFGEGTHDVVDMPSCPLHHPRIDQALAALRGAACAFGIAAYYEPLRKRKRRLAADERAPKRGGLLRYIQFTACSDMLDPGEDPDVRVQLVCVVNRKYPLGPFDPLETDDQLRALREMLRALWQHQGPAAHRPLFESMWINFQPAAGNAILGTHFERVYGPQWTWQRYGDASVALSPGSFMQANTRAMNTVLADMAPWVPDDTVMLDLHAGGAHHTMRRGHSWVPSNARRMSPCLS